MRHGIFFLFSPNEGGAGRLFHLFILLCSADHERNCLPPCKVVLLCFASFFVFMLEAAALRSIVLRYTGAPIATHVFFFFDVLLFPSIFCTISAFSSYVGEYVVRSFLPNGVFLPCDHGLDFLFSTSAYARIQSTKSIKVQYSFFGLATNTLDVRNNVLYCILIPSKRFEIFPPDWGMLRRSSCVRSDFSVNSTKCFIFPRNPSKNSEIS